MIKKILIAAVGIVAVLAVVIATRPAAFSIERSATINAPADLIYGNLTDFHAWAGWSPWAKLDPSMKTTYEGPASGLGAIYSWKGNDKVGEGKMTIKDVKPSQSVTIQLDFLAPMKATNTTQFTLKPAAGGTSVDWTMTGNNDFMGKAFSMVMDMDKMVGKDFESGLAGLKSLSEAEAAKRAEAAKMAAAAAAAPPAAPGTTAPAAPGAATPKASPTAGATAARPTAAPTSTKPH